MAASNEQNAYSMFHHAVSLLYRSWNAFVGSLGNTTLGFIAPFLVPTVGFMLVLAVVFFREGKEAVSTHVRHTLTLAFAVAIVGELMVYCPIFLWNAVETVYTDHQSLVARVHVLHDANSTMVSEKERLSHASEEKDKKIASLQGELNQSKRQASVHSSQQTQPLVIGVPEALPRRLTSQQKQSLFGELKLQPTVSGVYYDLRNSGPEVVDFEDDFKELFSKLAWPMKGEIIGLIPSNGRGMGVVVKSQKAHPPAADVLIRMLHEMGFQVEADIDQTGRLKADELRLVISSQK